MKYRNDFVTNSSSSSFVCEICGRNESGYDMPLSDAQMYECENEHVFCVEEALDVDSKEIIKYILENGYNKASYNADGEDYSKEDLEEMEMEDLLEIATEENGYYGVPECMCPICNFLVYSRKDMKNYLGKEYGISLDEAFTWVKTKNKRRKKLYDQEYINYVCEKEKLNPTDIVEKWKENFKTYHDFKKYIQK